MVIDESRLLGVPGHVHLLEQTVRYGYSEPITDLHQRLIVVPPAVHGSQRRIDWALEVSGVEHHSVRARCDRWANLVLDVRIPCVEQGVEFVVTARTEQSGARATTVRPSERYLSPTPLTSPGGRVASLARSIATVSPEKICSVVHQSLVYEYGITDVWTTAAEALVAGRGVCQDYAHVMLAVCRLLGMPARYVSGHLAGEGGSHAWVEVVVDDGIGGLVAEAWDPTHDRRTDERYLTVATGRDYADVAPLSGSFSNDDASSSLTVVKRVEHRAAAA